MENLKSHTGKFFEVSAKMNETQEDGSEKAVKHTIAVEADSFGDAEFMALEELTGSDIEVLAVNIAPYKEVFLSSDNTDENFYKAKLDFITIDEKTEKEKHTKVLYLVQASSIGLAISYIQYVMDQTMNSYESVGIVASNVEEVHLRK